VPEPSLLGDSDALNMACPQEAAAGLAAELPPGPVLELCCGVGGLTRELARAGRRVLAVDKDCSRLKANRANLAALGLEGQVSHLCCDLRRPALRTPASAAPFAACLLDPDWSPPGKPPDQWVSRLKDMSPPADDLIGLAFAFSPLVLIRLPRFFDPECFEVLPFRCTSSEVGGGGERWHWLALRGA